MGNVRLRDGIELDLATGETVVIDATTPTGDLNVVTHAHGDHLFSSPPERLVCSDMTARLAEVRRDLDGSLEPVSHDRIELLNAGHVVGSRAVFTDDGERTYLYPGDFCPRDRLYLQGFEPRTADVLITEATYGNPSYVFPSFATLEARIHDWLAETMDSPVLLFGYSVGKAQKLNRMLEESCRTRIFVSDAIQTINRAIAAGGGTTFSGKDYAHAVELRAGDAVVLPSQTSRMEFVHSIVDETGALTAGFSGWALDDSYKFHRGYDVTFPLSDHADFSELVATVRAVDPDIVYTHHGFADSLASHITAELGVPARSLKKHQSTLGDY